MCNIVENPESESIVEQLVKQHLVVLDTDDCLEKRRMSLCTSLMDILQSEFPADVSNSVLRRCTEAFMDHLMQGSYELPEVDFEESEVSNCQYRSGITLSLSGGKLGVRLLKNAYGPGSWRFRGGMASCTRTLSEMMGISCIPFLRGIEIGTQLAEESRKRKEERIAARESECATAPNSNRLFTTDGYPVQEFISGKVETPPRYTEQQISEAIQEAKTGWKGRQGFVYFIRNPVVSDVKIGFSAWPERRFKQHKCGNSAPLSLLGYVPAFEVDERSALSHWGFCRTSGEWFRETRELQKWIMNCINDGVLHLDDADYFAMSALKHSVRAVTNKSTLHNRM